jgi:hypothetical protein
MTGCATQPARFCVTADNRDFAGFAAVAEKIKQVPGGPGVLMVSVGDIDPPQATRQTVAKVFGPSFGWIPVVGNHDTGYVDAGTSAAEAPASLCDYFNRNLKGKVTPGPEGTRETTFSFDVGDVHIVILNEYWNGRPEPGSDAKGDGAVVAPLREWLRKDLAASRKPWKLVFGHVPAYPQPDQDLGDGRHMDGKDAPDRDAFWAVLQEQGVAAYINGHTHRYSRYLPPGSKVWQVDAAQARGGSDWQYDTFLVVSADAKRLTIDVYRNLKTQGQFEVTDNLTLPQPAAPKAPPRTASLAPAVQ